MGQSVIVKHALKMIDGELRNGFFVEAGALDGETRSNTLMFERDYGWKGLLVEADPKNYERLILKNRKAWTRTSDGKMWEIVVSEYSNEPLTPVVSPSERNEAGTEIDRTKIVEIEEVVNYKSNGSLSSPNIHHAHQGGDHFTSVLEAKIVEEVNAILTDTTSTNDGDGDGDDDPSGIIVDSGIIEQEFPCRRSDDKKKEKKMENGWCSQCFEKFPSEHSKECDFGRENVEQIKKFRKKYRKITVTLANSWQESPGTGNESSVIHQQQEENNSSELFTSSDDKRQMMIMMSDANSKIIEQAWSDNSLGNPVSHMKERQCVVCSAWFSSRFNRDRHVRRLHPYHAMS